MSIDDFTKNFNVLEICHLSPESFSHKTTEETQTQSMHGKSKKCWQKVGEYSSWRKNVSAGGCRKYIETFPMNPQFHVEVTETVEGKDTGLVIIGLMQKGA